MRRDDGLMESCEAGTEALAEAISACAEKMPAEGRAAVRGRLVAAITPEAVPLRVRLLRPAIALVTAGSMLGGVSYAAAVSAPGDLLYPVKRTVAAAYERVGQRAAQPKPAPAPADAAPATREPAAGKPAVVAPAPVAPKAGERKPSAVTTPGAAQGKKAGQVKPVDPKSNGNGKAAPKRKTSKRSSNGSGKGGARTHTRPSSANKR